MTRVAVTSNRSKILFFFCTPFLRVERRQKKKKKKPKAKKRKEKKRNKVLSKKDQVEWEKRGRVFWWLKKCTGSTS